MGVAGGQTETKSPSRNNRIDFELYLKSRLVNKALAELGDLKKRYRKRASKIERLFLDGPPTWPRGGQGRHPIGYCQGRRRWAIDRWGDNLRLRHNEQDHASSGLRGCGEHQPADSDSHNNAEATVRAHNGT